MRALYFDIDPGDITNYKTEKEPSHFKTLHELGHAANNLKNFITGKTRNKKIPGAKTNDSSILQDFFGALNY
ncbi:MAG: hypothetical protein ABIO79_06065 [Ferruginibacter sp.]